MSRAVRANNGTVKHILEFAKTPGSLLTNLAMLAGATGLTAQLAMQPNAVQSGPSVGSRLGATSSTC
ncbi:MAG: hypothetical protein ACRCZD_06915 [Phycicoccus sp.]